MIGGKGGKAIQKFRFRKVKVCRRNVESFGGK